NYFLPQLKFGSWEKQYFAGIKSPKRRLSWLASRYLLKQVLGTDQFVELLFDAYGKPYLGNYNMKISLSHTDNYAAAIVSAHHDVGIDVEESLRDIRVIRNKFLSETEIKQLSSPESNTELMLYWSAKEVIYKIYGKRKLEFKEDMFIKPFTMGHTGSMKGLLLKNGAVSQYHLHYLVKPAFLLVFGTDTEVDIISIA
ncbi:MAG: 4'-phosphopantetheinyl transferase family protein, partial [Bacteroidia bacterium]